MPEHQETAGSGWWEQRWLLLLLVLLAAVPLLRPHIPPLLDLPSHIGRYRIQMDYASWPVFHRYYSMHWMVIGNLGIDLLVVPLTPLIGLEPAVKWIVAAIPLLTAAGLLWTAKEAHGRVPPTAFFALPLVYNFPFHFGFVNYALGMGFTLILVALWLRLARLGRLRLRAALFVPLALLLWLVHTYAWAFFGVVAFGAEFVRQRGQDREWKGAAVHAALGCLCLAPPLLPMMLWRTSDASAASITDGFFNPVTKTNYLITLFRDRWRWFDLASLGVIGVVAGFALRRWREAFAPVLASALVLLLICYLLIPARLLGSSYADLRILPYTAALGLVAIRPFALSPKRLSQIAMIGLAFVAARTAGTTASFWLYAEAYERELPAIGHLPEGTRLIALIAAPCRGLDWEMRRLDHLSGLAIARKRVFSNDQWSLPGAQLVLPRYPAAEPYAADPSQIVRIEKCPTGAWPTLDESLSRFPRNAFDYVWLIRPPAFDHRLLQGLEPVWTNGESTLYRITDRRQPGALPQTSASHTSATPTSTMSQ